MDSNSIDWEAVWKSLVWVDHDHDEEAVRERLRQRARQYAAPLVQPETDAEDALNLMVFELGGEVYGIDVQTVRGVRAIGHITRVPGVPSFYRGVVNIRGQVITVLDIRLLLGIDVSDEALAPEEIVIIRANGLELGLLAHDVRGIEVVPQEKVEPMDNMPYAMGVTANRIVLLDIELLAKDERLIVGGKDEL